MEISKDNLNNINDEVEDCCYNPIKNIFKTLLLERQLIQQNVADSLGVDKAYISRIFNGVEIPDLNMRLKIAKFFSVDSTVIWRPKDLDVIRKILNNQKKFEK